MNSKHRLTCHDICRKSEHRNYNNRRIEHVKSAVSCEEMPLTLSTRWKSLIKIIIFDTDSWFTARILHIFDRILSRKTLGDVPGDVLKTPRVFNEHAQSADNPMISLARRVQLQECYNYVHYMYCIRTAPWKRLPLSKVKFPSDGCSISAWWRPTKDICRTSKTSRQWLPAKSFHRRLGLVS